MFIHLLSPNVTSPSTNDAHNLTISIIISTYPSSLSLYRLYLVVSLLSVYKQCKRSL